MPVSVPPEGFVWTCRLKDGVEPTRHTRRVTVKAANCWAYGAWQLASAFWGVDPTQIVAKREV